MLKNKKIFIAIAIACVCAVIAGGMIISFLTPQRTTVYIFRDDFKAGTVITTEMLYPVQVDSKIVVAGSSAAVGSHFVTINNYSNIVGDNNKLKADVQKGDPLMTTMLSSVGNTEIEVRMNPASIAVTIPATNISGVTSSLRAECYVNVYTTYSSGGTYLLLEKIRILSVASNDSGLTGVTLELNNSQAVNVINATNTGSIYLGLVNGDGYVYVPQTPDSNE